MLREYVDVGESGAKDSVFTGTYQMDETSFTAQIMVRHFLPDVPHSLGVQGDFAMDVKGAVIGQIIKAIAGVVG